MVGDDAIPRHICASVWRHCSWKGETEGNLSCYIPQSNTLVQNLLLKAAALKEDGGLRLVQLKGRDTFLNTLRGGYVTSKEIISSNLFFLLPAFSLAATDWLERETKNVNHIEM